MARPLAAFLRLAPPRPDQDGGRGIKNGQPIRNARENPKEKEPQTRIGFEWILSG